MLMPGGGGRYWPTADMMIMSGVGVGADSRYWPTAGIMLMPEIGNWEGHINNTHARIEGEQYWLTVGTMPGEGGATVEEKFIRIAMLAKDWGYDSCRENTKLPGRRDIQ